MDRNCIKSKIDSYLNENEITTNQYKSIVNLMELVSYKIDCGEKIGRSYYENRIFEIMPDIEGEEHVCEYIAKLFLNVENNGNVYKSFYKEI